MTAILAIFNDSRRRPQHFEKWYNREHLQERVGVPGFRFGRRYALAAGGDREFFAYYGVDSPAVLNSPAYLKRLENPTPWTTQTMQSFRNMVRTVCDLRIAAGDLIGSHAVVLRADQLCRRRRRQEPSPRRSPGGGIARVQIWTKAAQQTAPIRPR